MDVGLNDDLLVRALKGVPSAEALPPLPPSDPSSVSSIAKASPIEQADTSLRPQLEPPKHFMYGWLHAYDKLIELADKQARLAESQVKGGMAEVEQLDADKMEKLRKSAEATQSQHTWGILSDVAEYVMSGSTMMLGAAALPAAPWIGGCLVSSGAIGLAGRVMHDTGATQAVASWFAESTEVQKRIATVAERAMSAVSLVLRMGAGASAYFSGALAAVPRDAANLQKTLETVGIAVGVSKSASDFGKSYAEQKQGLLQGDLTKINAHIDRLHQNVYRDARDAQNFVDMIGAIGEELKQAISTSVVHQD